MGPVGSSAAEVLPSPAGRATGAAPSTWVASPRRGRNGTVTGPPGWNVYVIARWETASRYWIDGVSDCAGSAAATPPGATAKSAVEATRVATRKSEITRALTPRPSGL